MHASVLCSWGEIGSLIFLMNLAIPSVRALAERDLHKTLTKGKPHTSPKGGHNAPSWLIYDVFLVICGILERWHPKSFKAYLVQGSWTQHTRSTMYSDFISCVNELKKLASPTYTPLIHLATNIIRIRVGNRIKKWNPYDIHRVDFIIVFPRCHIIKKRNEILVEIVSHSEEFHSA